MFITLNKIYTNSNLPRLYNRQAALAVPNYNNINGRLTSDVVSFSSRAKLIAESMKYAPSEINCRRACDNAEPARFYLESLLHKYILPITAESSEDKISDFPVERYSTRLKSPSSVREKVVSKYAKLQREEVEKFSEQAYEEFSKYGQLNSRVPKSDVIRFIKGVINKNQYLKDGPVYLNAPYALTVLFEELGNKKYFDFSQMSENDVKNMYTHILENFEESIPKYTTDGSVFIDPETMQGIKHYANDIVGARILLRQSDAHYTSLVIDALKKAVEDGNLKIKTIENNIPDPDKLKDGEKMSDYFYATERQLRSLAKAADAELVHNNSKTGYLAIHINADLSSNMLGDPAGQYNGYMGEIQIIGRDIEKLKDVEDLCYKLKDNKNAIHTAYKPFVDHFKKYYNPSTSKAFDDYTYALYLAQRISKNGNGNGAFPTIAQLGFESKVPSQLDFNTLKRIKASCDAERIKMDEEQTAPERQTRTAIKKRSMINEIKSYISYCLK